MKFYHSLEDGTEKARKPKKTTPEAHGAGPFPFGGSKGPRKTGTFEPLAVSRCGPLRCLCILRAFAVMPFTTRAR